MGEWSSCRRRPRMHQKDAGWPARTLKYGGLPPPSGHSYHAVPPWERKFCSQISWAKLCADKKLTYLFENVLNWDDSAGKESFYNAKARYWAEINGLQCDIPLPNPDMYIDVVNQDTFLDPHVVEDLYKQPPPPPLKEAPDYNSVEIIPTGWDVEDPVAAGGSIPIFISAEPSRCGYTENLILKSDEPVAIIPTGWGDKKDFGSESRKVVHRDTNSGRRSYSSWGRVRGSWGDGGCRFSSKHATLMHQEQ